jgi:hypothetical protein
VIVERDGAFAVWCDAFVPVIATPAMRPAPTVKPARTISSLVMESSFRSPNRPSARSARHPFESRRVLLGCREVVAGFC